MLRFLCFCFLVAFAQPGHAQPAPPAPQHQQAARILWEVMQLDQLAPTLRDEALAEGREMAATMFPRGGTGRWLEQVAAIHTPARIRALFLRGVAEALPSTDPAHLQAGLAFYRTGLGRQLLALETRARVAMLDDKVEEAARRAWEQAQRQSTPRADRIERLIQAADLIEPNVAGGLNASVAFARGFEAGGGFPMPMGEDQMIADAWAEEPRMRADTESWIGAYLFLAYASLSDAQLDLYTIFAQSDGGRALARVMFAGFDGVFTRTSQDMGLAAAAELRGRQL
ncbi:hypothetical protein [Paracoccus aerius]|uniref:DUF2059 domain-containing protein n=1 Tax=Paracoccus aerius TaxID=1915382 RepID=A0ABS1S4J8_9RHOB|nr:hypothetical protein [Paracoccus aerius]MBL3673648.1 hypothetical protein [Paracoccus aerius]GHG22421.1 hypothetical protein GCM10017322_19970 [Paracoccus aerius]